MSELAGFLLVMALGVALLIGAAVSAITAGRIPGSPYGPRKPDNH